MSAIHETCVVTFVMVFALFVAFCRHAHAQDVHHHAGMSASVDKFYSTWFMPDNPSKSCCNTTDCYPTPAKFKDGQWWALRRGDDKYIPIPWAKVETNRDSPDGRSHLCEPGPTPSHPPNTVFCFAPGGGT